GRDRGALLDAAEANPRMPGDPGVWLALVRATARVKGAAAGAAVAQQAPAELASDPGLVQELSALRAGRVDRSQPARRGREPDPDHADRWPGALGATMREWVGTIARQDWAGAEALAATAGRAYPETLMGPWLEGVLAAARKQLEPAERLFRDALVVSPRSH